jgi:hypothetical protein
MRFPKKESPCQDLQDHSQLKIDERVRKQRLLENPNGHPLHHAECDRVNNQPIPI